MSERPYTLLSCSVSLDGYLGGPGAQRLVLSNDDDLDRVDGTRADVDAIMVGAATVRRDDPRLLVRDAERCRTRVRRGLAPQPAKVTVTGCGRLDPDAAFFTVGEAEKLVYCPTATAAPLRHRLGSAATVVEGGDAVAMRWLSEDLHDRGVRRLMVEGGGTLHTQFLTEELADELQLVVAPLFVGDARARRFVGDGRFPWHAGQRARLAEVRRLGDVALLRYALSGRYDAHTSAR